MHPLLSKKAENPSEKPAVNVDEYAQQLVYWNDVYDCHQGECFGAIYGSYKAASPSAPVAAKLTYSTYENEIHVKMIEVHPQIRRRGVGTKLYNRLKQEYPDMKINWGMSTPDGTEWLKSVQGSSQIKVSKKAHTPARMYFGEGVESSKIAGKKPSKNATVQINIPHELAWKMQQAAKAVISKSDLAGDGFEIHPHITVKYGVEEDEDKLLEAIDGQEPFEITLGKTHVFEPSGASDATAPVVIEINSSDLKALHEAVGKAIGNRKDDFEYKAHATLAYVKPEASKKYDGLDFLEGVSFTAEEITLSKKSRAQITIPFGEAPATKTANADATHSLTMTADVEGFPPMVLVRWPQKGVRWRTVLKVVKQIAAEVARKRVPWRDINIFQSPWNTKQEQDEAWGRATGRPMYDIMEDGSYVAVGQNPPNTEAKLGAAERVQGGPHDDLVCPCGNTTNGQGFYPCDSVGQDMGAHDSNWDGELYRCDRCGRIINARTRVVKGLAPTGLFGQPAKMGTHKVTPFGDTEYQNPEIGEENNGYAMEPDKVKGTSMVPTLEELAPDLFKTGAINNIPTIEELLQDRGMSLGEAQGDWDKIRAECAERVKAEGGDWEKLTDAQKEAWEEKVGWEWLRGNWAEAEDKLRALQFPLTVYRGIAGKTLRDIYHGLPGDKDWYGQPKGFGVYWSWNEHNAYVHEELAASAEDIIMFRGVIRMSNVIDWMATSWSHLVAPDEFEIDLYPGSQIEITGWKKRGETQWRTPPKNFRTITAAYAEAQNQTQHYQPPTGLYKVLKSDPFAEEWDLFGPKEAAVLVPDQIDNPDKEFSGAFEFAKSLGWRGVNPWYPEKYPWLALRVYSDGWRITNDMAKVTMAEGTTLGELKQFLSKYDLKKLRSESVGTTLRAQPVPKKLNATLKSIQAARVPLRPQPEFIYHVSEVSNEESIKTHGINPELSQQRWNPGDKGFYAFTEYMDAVKYIGDVASNTDAGINFQIWRVKPTTTVVTDDSFFVDELPAPQWQDDSGEANHSAVFHPGAVPAANLVLVALFDPDSNQFLFEDRSKIAAIKSETKTMYHVTPQENLESISKMGLQPVDGKLYLASILPDSGVGSVEAEAENEQVWLEVQVPAGLELHPDPEFPGEAHSFYTTQPIPAKNIAVVQPQTRQRVPLEKLAASAKPIHENVESAPFKIGMLGVRFSNGDLHEFWGEELEPATGEKQAKGQTIGQAYLLHFDIPGGRVVEPSREDADKPFHARHYLGWAEDAEARIKTHYNAQSGVKIIDAIHQKNITFSVARIWDQVDRNFERRLKDQGGLSRHCPICKQQGLIPASRYRGKALQDIQVAPATPNAGPDFIELEN
jgi:2'-5' RNA ligase/GNAT superfamily N-acetyltransferase